MKISARGPSLNRRAGRADAAGRAFTPPASDAAPAPPTAPAGGPAGTEAVAAAAAPSGVASVQAVMALQGAGPQSGREAAIARGSATLDLLDEARLALLEGRDAGEVFRRLNSLWRHKQAGGSNADQEPVLRAIELRAAVELAKRQAGMTRNSLACDSEALHVTNQPRRGGAPVDGSGRAGDRG